MGKLSLRSRGIAGVAILLAASLGAGITTIQTRVSGDERPAAKSPRDAEAINHAKDLSHAFRNATEAVGPAVVKIRSHTNAKKVSGIARGRNPLQGKNPLQGTPFEDMFPDFQNDGGSSRGTPERDGVGSGVIIDKSGIVLTNNHVVKDSDDLVVTLADGREFKAADVKTDPQTDLAVLHSRAKRFAGGRDGQFRRHGNRRLGHRNRMPVRTRSHGRAPASLAARDAN